MRTCILCVDFQKNLTMPWGGNYYKTAEDIMPECVKKISIFRELGAQIIYIWTKCHQSSGLTTEATTINSELEGRKVPRPEEGYELDSRLTIDKRDIVLRKFTYSAFWGTPLLEILQQNGIENVLVCGIKTNVCCRQTAIDAASHGFKTYMIEDMTSTNNEELKKFHLQEINQYFAKVIRSDEVVERLEKHIF